MSTRVFVYGTLRTGECRAHLLKDCKNLGVYKTEPEYTLVDFGPFPGLIGGGETAIIGEVVEVDELTLNLLDTVEGHPNFYTRRPVRLADGPVDYIDNAVTYFAPESQVQGVIKVIVNGDWCRRDSSSLFTS